MLHVYRFYGIPNYFFPLGAVIIRLLHEIVVLSYLVFAFDLRLIEVFTGWS